MDITVTEPEKRVVNTDMLKDTFMVYLVQTKCTGHGGPDDFEKGTHSVWRRYSEFDLLRNYFNVTYPYIIIPPIPEKKLPSFHMSWKNITTDTFDQDFIERRRSGLEAFLHRVAQHPTLCQDRIFHSFLQKEEGWKEVIQSTNFQSKADSRIHKLNSYFRVQRVDKRFGDLRHYADNLHNNIAAILRIRHRMVNSVFFIYKGHRHYGSMFSFSDSITGVLEDEELNFHDLLKEYMLYADSIRSITKKHEILQFEIERSEEALVNKRKLRDESGLSQSKSSSSTSDNVSQPDEDAEQQDEHSSEDSEEQKQSTGPEDESSQSVAQKPRSAMVSNVVGGIGKVSRGFGSVRRKVQNKVFGEDAPEIKENKLKAIDDNIKELEKTLDERRLEAKNFGEKANEDLERFYLQRDNDIRELLMNYVSMQIDVCKKARSYNMASHERIIWLFINHIKLLKIRKEI
ncbi:uncharacterized protein TRIADDRAFT_53558 [Trichoplax adhaerens]|uniref:PX domain-containing protein n=1 Tax=Trichoplax adhaerens TaxID=10228 RepID=B3RPI8_TRIAD|nr:hypothetical protein TRIADDRAFT_53558 [Trichoplax adhaerens]EDV27645.1 hypothetical protein TRIADDRAFT_53558 [Trichoplax adhaerens]|eukprot:XP_002109479.1 hypothetical protein TRIADDRAFT_53558 [Trichoplax adhaerens]